jgi:hypothetical protein
MDESIAIYLANRVGQLELDKAGLMSDLAQARKFCAVLEERIKKLEVNDADAISGSTVAPTQ